MLFRSGHRRRPDRRIIFEMFLYELGNHEYDVTMDLDETLAALDYTMDAIQADPRLSHGLERARLEILGATS